MSSDVQEAAVLEIIVPQLQAEGFDVYVSPGAHVIPSFMSGYRPDAVALRNDKKLAVEILSENPSSKARLAKLRGLLAGHDDWELRVYWLNPSAGAKPIESVSRPVIEGSIKDIEALVKEGWNGPALIMAWAAFEALARALLPDRFARPQTPARLTEILASEGHLTPGEADQVRRLAEIRNKFVHGGLSTSISETDVRRFVEVLKTLLGSLPESSLVPA